MKKKVGLLFVLFFASGFAGLIYESVWSHYVKLFLGHAAYAQTLVLVVFIGGLAGGAWICARAAERLRNPLRAYAWVEAAVGALALVFHLVFVAVTDWGYAVLLPAACEQASSFCPAQWLLAAALLLPQSILLGMSFPLMSSAVLRLDPAQPGHHVAALYFFNSFGAVLGVLASAFLLIPALGLPGALVAAGLLNAAIAMAAYFASRLAPSALAVVPAAPTPSEERETPRLAGLLLLTALLTGLSSFIYEIAWIRMLSLVLGSTTHAFELMLAAFILGLAAGGLWIRNRIDAIADPVRYLGMVQIAMGLAAAATIAVYNGAFDLMALLLSSIARTSGGYILFNLSSTLIALLVMLPATFCAGMTLPLITYRLLRSPTGERALGLVYAVNTLGSIVGVVIAVHLLLGWVGLRGTVLAGAAIDVALGVLLLLGGRMPSVRSIPRAAIAGVAAFAVIAFVFDVDPRRSASGVFRTGHATLAQSESIAFHRDGKTATVDVLDERGIRSIRTNGKSDAALTLSPQGAPTKDEFTMALLALLPMGHQPNAQSAAVVGFGSGMTTTLLLGSSAIRRVDTVEIEPAMVEGARLFGPIVAPAFHDPRSRIVIDDAKSYFARGRERYDIIVSEPSNPWVSGVASLFTEEFYRRIAGYLNDGGVVCQWLHTYEMDARTLASILKAMAKTFPDFLVYSTVDSDIVLIARKGGPPGTFDAAALRHPALEPVVERLRLQEADVIRRRAVGSWQHLGPFFESYGGLVNSDYRPVVDHAASRTRFSQVQVRELLELQGSSTPMLELLGGAPVPAERPLDAARVTFVESATAQAWALHRLIFAEKAADAGGELHVRELAARLVHLWATRCPPELTFEHVLASMVSVAEDINPRIGPESAARLWRRIAQSPCGASLDEPARRWLALFEASALRDPSGMARYGLQVLDARRGMRGAVSEYAFFAAVTGVVASGDFRLAMDLLRSGGENWIRPTANPTQMRFLASVINAAARRSP